MLDAQVEAAEALRRLGHALVVHAADADACAEVAAAARALLPRIQAAPRRDRAAAVLARGPFALSAADIDLARVLPERAVGGPANPMAVEMTGSAQGEEIVARVVFHEGFEGPPGRAHGGMVSAVFDDITGFAMTFVGEPAFTVRLTVDFVAPVPMGVPLEFRARLDRRDGRRLYITSEATHVGSPVARAEALYLVMGRPAFGGTEKTNGESGRG